MWKGKQENCFSNASLIDLLAMGWARKNFRGVDDVDPIIMLDETWERRYVESRGGLRQ